jgi:hypothetical protein
MQQETREMKQQQQMMDGRTCRRMQGQHDDDDDDMMMLDWMTWQTRTAKPREENRDNWDELDKGGIKREGGGGGGERDYEQTVSCDEG